MDKEKIIKNYIDMAVSSCHNIKYDEIKDIYDVLLETNYAGGRIYICGNGGSGSTASHFQNDLNNAFSISYGTMPAVCLTDNIATLTAVSNDFSYDDVFLHQLKYLIKEKDVLITISGSGNSINILKAAEYVKNRGNTVVSMVGFNGGKLKALSDYSFHVPVDNMQVSEDLHLLFCHLISTMIRVSKEEDLNDKY